MLLAARGNGGWTVRRGLRGGSRQVRAAERFAERGRSGLLAHGCGGRRRPAPGRRGPQPARSAGGGGALGFPRVRALRRCHRAHRARRTGTAVRRRRDVRGPRGGGRHRAQRARRRRPSGHLPATRRHHAHRTGRRGRTGSVRRSAPSGRTGPEPGGSGPACGRPVRDDTGRAVATDGCRSRGCRRGTAVSRVAARDGLRAGVVHRPGGAGVGRVPRRRTLRRSGGTTGRRAVALAPTTAPGAGLAVLGEQLGDGALPRVVDLRPHRLHRAPSLVKVQAPLVRGAPSGRCVPERRTSGAASARARTARTQGSAGRRIRVHTRRLLPGRDEFVTRAVTHG
jgi:hypothetical protein